MVSTTFVDIPVDNTVVPAQKKTTIDKPSNIFIPGTDPVSTVTVMTSINGDSSKRNGTYSGESSVDMYMEVLKLFINFRERFKQMHGQSFFLFLSYNPWSH